MLLHFLILLLNLQVFEHYLIVQIGLLVCTELGPQLHLLVQLFVLELQLQQLVLQRQLRALLAVDAVEELLLQIILPCVDQWDGLLRFFDFIKLLDHLLDLLVVEVFSRLELSDPLRVIDDLRRLVIVVLLDAEAIERSVELFYLLFGNGAVA